MQQPVWNYRNSSTLAEGVFAKITVLSICVFLFVFFRRRTRKRKKRNQKEKKEKEKGKKNATERKRRKGNEKGSGKERGRGNVKNGNDEKRNEIGTEIGMNATETVNGRESGIERKHGRKIGIPNAIARRSVITMKKRRWREGGERGNRERRMQHTKRYKNLAVAFCIVYRQMDGYSQSISCLTYIWEFETNIWIPLCYRIYPCISRPFTS